MTNPMVGQGRIAFTFGHPFEGDLEDLVIRRVSALEDDRGDLTTVEVTLLGVLNLHLATDITREQIVGKLHHSSFITWETLVSV